MRSAANSPVSLSQLLHGGEEVRKSGQGNAVSFQVNSTSKSGDSQATTVQLNSTTQAKTPNNLPLKDQVSVEPMHMSPCPVTKSNDIISMDTHCHGMGRRYGANNQRWPNRPDRVEETARKRRQSPADGRRPGSQVAERSADKECTICRVERGEMK